MNKEFYYDIYFKLGVAEVACKHRHLLKNKKISDELWQIILNFSEEYKKPITLHLNKSINKAKAAGVIKADEAATFRIELKNAYEEGRQFLINKIRREI